MKEVIVCGSMNMDLICTTPRIPLPGETIIGKDFIIKEGGKGANQAVAIAKLGIPTHMIGCVGSDSFGEALLLSLRASGVDTGSVLREECCTGTAHITVEDSGENNIVVIPGANTRLTARHVRSCREMIASAEAAVTQLEISLEAVGEFLDIAKSHGLFTVLNPAPLPQGGVPDDLIRLADLITPNETEIEMLTGIAVVDEATFAQAARKLHGRGVEEVICTLGAKGALYSDGKKIITQKAFRVSAVDTTCAGDSFTGAFVVRRLEGSTVEEALLFAARAAALTVTRLGAQETLPTRTQVEAAEGLVG